MADDIKAITTDRGKVLASWEFPEFVKHERTRGWYVWTGLVALGLAIYAFFSANYLFLLIILMFLGVIWLRGRRHPMMLRITISEDGVAIGNTTFYPWKEIKNFWIIYEPPEVKNLYLDLSGLRPSISVSLENQNPLTIRKHLLEYLPEDTEKEEESVSDSLTRSLRL